MTGTAPAIPSRLVDADNQGWYATSETAGGPIVYRADFGLRQGLPRPLTLDAITRDRGPWRSVQPITDDDDTLIRDTFGRVGRKTIATLAAALEEVFHELRESRGGLATAHDSWEYANRTLTAGRAGSWESDLLRGVVMLGNGLNLVGGGRVSRSIEWMRQHGPNRRVDVEGRATLAAVLRRWVTGPDRYTEVAATLAGVVSSYADDTAGPDGWRAVADQWLQPAALAGEDFRACYRLFYSQSDHYNPDLA